MASDDRSPYREPFFPTPTPELAKVVADDQQRGEQDRKDRELQLANVARVSSNDNRPPANNRLEEAKLTAIASDFLNQFPSAKRYVIVYGVKDFFRADSHYTILIKKPDDCKMHAGLFNLPGGKIEYRVPDGATLLSWEDPSDAAVREFGEETGYVASFPTLCGLITPCYNQQSFDPDCCPPPFLVYCYKAIYSIAPYQGQHDDPPPVMTEVDVAKSFQWKDGCVPNIPLILSLFHADVAGWILKEDDWSKRESGQYGVWLDLVHPLRPYTYWQMQPVQTPEAEHVP